MAKYNYNQPTITGWEKPVTQIVESRPQKLSEEKLRRKVLVQGPKEARVEKAFGITDEKEQWRKAAGLK
jgi:hypothetical protein